MFNKSNLDPSKVNNIHSLLTVFLIIVESLLGYWMYRAGSPVERIVAGLLIVGVFLAFLFLVYKIRNILSTPRPSVDDQNVSPASKEASEDEIKQLTAEQIAGPGGTYTINMPPSSWNIKYMDINSLARENLDIPQTTQLPGQSNVTDGQKNILLLQSKNLYEIIPVPGKTVINGRIIPTALTTRVPIQLAIIPLERLQPPFYSENPFVHNVYTYIGQILQFGVLNMQKNFSGILKHTGREFIQADLVQQLDHVDFSINNQVIKDCSGLKNNITVIGIKGDIIDHLLLMYYPSWSDPNLFNTLNDELEILKSLTNSFRPLKEPDAISKLNSIRERGKQSYELVLQHMDDTSFFAELFLVLNKIKGLNQKNPADQKRIVNLLHPFQQLYKEIKMSDSELDALWESLAEAEGPNKQPLLDNLNNLIAEMDAKTENPATDGEGESGDDVKQIG